MNTNPTFQESALYLAKYKHCLSRALGMVKLYVTKSLESATQQVLPKPGIEKPSSDNAAVLYYGKFRTNAPRIKTLMAEIEDRVENSPEYLNLLSDCHQCYFAQRQTLMGPCVADAVTELSQKYQRDYCSLVRSGCAFLVHVCEDEYNLFHQVRKKMISFISSAKSRCSFARIYYYLVIRFYLIYKFVCFPMYLLRR